MLDQFPAPRDRLEQQVAGRTDGLDDVVKAGTIKIGIFEDFPPFASLGSDMKIDGYDVEMADLIAMLQSASQSQKAR